MTERTRVVAFRLASNAIGTVTHVAGRRDRPRGRRARLGRRRPLRPARPDRRRRARRRRPRSARRTSSTGHTSASRSGNARSGAWRPYNVSPRRPIPGPVRDRHARARAACRLVAASSTSKLVGWDASARTSRARSSGSSTGCPTMPLCTASRRWTSACRRSRSPSTGSRHSEVADAAGRARLRRLARQLLRGRDHAAARPSRRCGARGDRPLQHGRRGRRGCSRHSTALDGDQSGRRHRAPSPEVPELAADRLRVDASLSATASVRSWKPDDVDDRVAVGTRSTGSRAVAAPRPRRERVRWRDPRPEAFARPSRRSPRVAV